MEKEYTVIGVYPDNLQSFMTCAKGRQPDEAARAARASIEEDYSREHLHILIILEGNHLTQEVPFTREA